MDNEKYWYMGTSIEYAKLRSPETKYGNIWLLGATMTKSKCRGQDWTNLMIAWNHELSLWNQKKYHNHSSSVRQFSLRTACPLLNSIARAAYYHLQNQNHKSKNKYAKNNIMECEKETRIRLKNSIKPQPYIGWMHAWNKMSEG